MRNLILRGGLLVALTGTCLWPGIVLSQIEKTTSEPPKQGEGRKGVLVLKTGQLVEGELSQRAGGYLVELPKGSYLIPFERVSVAADDRHAAYGKLKALEPNPTPDFQVTLARWCITWKLYQEARLELRDALVADPNHQAAREMYARLHQLLHPEQAVEEKPKPKTREGFEAADAESLAGLSPEAAKQYVIRVQPLLLNRCGNAACHGPASPQEFQLAHVRRGLNRTTLENLNAVLRYVDRSDPEKSPLLKISSGTHGRNGRPIFYGAAGEQNLATLREWVAQLANDPTGDSKNPATNAFARRTREEEPDETLIRGVPEESPSLTPEQRAEQEKEELLNSILQNEQEDAFDPDEFNRRFGGP